MGTRSTAPERCARRGKSRGAPAKGARTHEATSSDFASAAQRVVDRLATAGAPIVCRQAGDNGSARVQRAKAATAAASLGASGTLPNGAASSTEIASAARTVNARTADATTRNVCRRVGDNVLWRHEPPEPSRRPSGPAQSSGSTGWRSQQHRAAAPCVAQRIAQHEQRRQLRSRRPCGPPALGLQRLAAGRHRDCRRKRGRATNLRNLCRRSRDQV